MMNLFLKSQHSKHLHPESGKIHASLPLDLQEPPCVVTLRSPRNSAITVSTSPHPSIHPSHHSFELFAPTPIICIRLQFETFSPSLPTLRVHRLTMVGQTTNTPAKDADRRDAFSGMSVLSWADDSYWDTSSESEESSSDESDTQNGNNAEIQRIVMMIMLTRHPL